MKFFKFEGTAEELQVAYPLLYDPIAEVPENKAAVAEEPTLVPLAEPIKTNELTEDAVVTFFTRIPLTKTHSALIKTLFNAPNGQGFTTSELAKLIKCPSGTIKGSMRAFGKRVAHTEGWPSGVEAFDRKWLGSENVYRLHPAVRVALETGRVKF